MGVSVRAYFSEIMCIEIPNYFSLPFEVHISGVDCIPAAAAEL